jgi:hypothetical protein
MKQLTTSIAAFVMLLLPVAGICAGDMPSLGNVNNGVAGKVVETATAGDYTYVLLEKDGKKAWAACPVIDTAVGQQLAFTGCSPMMDFESKALKRTFKIIMFCGEPLSKDATELILKTSSGSAGQVPVSNEKIVVEGAKGANAYTIEDLYSKRKDLDKKQVVVKGKVMKVSSGIMHRTWIHLQDGTGSPLKKNNDLVVTTEGSAQVGDVVTVSGTFANDKDFGAGYKYNAIVELATVTK